MAPPTRAAENDDDLDDLNDVLDEFQSSSSVAAPTKPVPAVPSLATPVEGQTEEFPDPDDDPLSDGEDLNDAEFAEQLQREMASMMGEMDGLEGGGDFAKMMEQMLKGSGIAGAGGAEEPDMAALLAALGMGGEGMLPPGPMGALKPSTSGTKGKAKDSSSTTASPTGNFQDTIAAAMNKMQNTTSTIDQETEDKKAAAGDPLAAMMAQMAGLEGLGGEEGIKGMLDEVMGQLMSRELLYEPLNELANKYPAYLEENKDALSAADLKRFQDQHKIVLSIVAKFDEPGAESEMKGDPEAVRRNGEVVALVEQMNACGAPPKELMGEMPAGMEVGPDGVPALPEGCTVC